MGRAQRCCKHPMVHRTAPTTKNHVTLNVNSTLSWETLNYMVVRNAHFCTRKTMLESKELPSHKSITHILPGFHIPQCFIWRHGVYKHTRHMKMGQKLHHQCFGKKKKKTVILTIKSFVWSHLKLTHKKRLSRWREILWKMYNSTFLINSDVKLFILCVSIYLSAGD